MSNKCIVTRIEQRYREDSSEPASVPPRICAPKKKKRKSQKRERERAGTSELKGAATESVQVQV